MCPVDTIQGLHLVGTWVSRLKWHIGNATLPHHWNWLESVSDFRFPDRFIPSLVIDSMVGELFPTQNGAKLSKNFLQHRNFELSAKKSFFSSGSRHMCTCDLIHTVWSLQSVGLTGFRLASNVRCISSDSLLFLLLLQVLSLVLVVLTKIRIRFRRFAL